MTTLDEKIQRNLEAAKNQIEAVRVEAYDYYQRSVEQEGDDQGLDIQLTKAMQERDALVDEMCRILANLRTVAQCRLYEKKANQGMVDIF